MNWRLLSVSIQQVYVDSKLKDLFIESLVNRSSKMFSFKIFPQAFVAVIGKVQFFLS